MGLYNANGELIHRTNELFVMCFNVQRWQGLNSNAALMKKIIDTYQPDIIALQEFTETIGESNIYSTVFAGYPYHYFASDIQNPVGIISKYQLSDTTTTIYESQGAERRGYAKVYFTVNQQRICLLNTHLEIMPSTEESRTVRTEQAQELISVMRSERYAICCGDFNVGNCHDKTDADYIAVIKPFLDEGYHSANSSDQHGFLATFYDGTKVNNYTRYACIDEILTTSNIDINMVTVDKAKSDANTSGAALDHLPIIAYCRVNG